MNPLTSSESNWLWSVNDKSHNTALNTKNHMYALKKKGKVKPTKRIAILERALNFTQQKWTTIKNPANNGSPNEHWVNNNRTNALERAAAYAADLSAFLVP